MPAVLLRYRRHESETQSRTFDERLTGPAEALVRLEDKGFIKGAWDKTENNREAKFYRISKAGERELERQTERWRRLAGLVEKLLLES